MTKIKIEVFEGGTPSATITVPLWVVRSAAKLLPKIAGKELREQIDVEQIVELTKNPQANGVVMEIEDHKENQRVVVSIVGDEAPAAGT
ncbi:MAG TPA: hypothetical protein VG758_06650 [Hyphomicrobiaceae bacterium]|jgi:hypothetical protein|nr:hypothetical protein [Hyphomicrobiaceae bacterium]